MRELQPSEIVAIIDSREQAPLNLAPLGTSMEVLDTGDYSVRGLESQVRIERKSLADLVACVGRERKRFEREVQRLMAFPVRVLVVEATWQQIETHSEITPQWRGQVTPSQVIGSLIGWQAAGLAVHLVGDHKRAGTHVSRLLYTVAKRRWRELQVLASTLNAHGIAGDTRENRGGIGEGR